MSKKDKKKKDKKKKDQILQLSKKKKGLSMENKQEQFTRP